MSAVIHIDQQTTLALQSVSQTLPLADAAPVCAADFLTYIQEDASVLPRAAIITVSGLGGIVAGYRGQ